MRFDLQSTDSVFRIVAIISSLLSLYQAILIDFVEKKIKMIDLDFNSVGEFKIYYDKHYNDDNASFLLFKQY